MSAPNPDDVVRTDRDGNQYDAHENLIGHDFMYGSPSQPDPAPASNTGQVVLSGSGSPVDLNDSLATGLGCFAIAFFFLFPIAIGSLMWQKTFWEDHIIRNVTKLNHLITFGSLVVGVGSFLVLLHQGEVTSHPLRISNRETLDTIPLLLFALSCLYVPAGIITYAFIWLNSRVSRKYPGRTSTRGYSWFSLVCLITGGKPQVFWTYVQNSLIACVIALLVLHNLWYVGVGVGVLLVWQWFLIYHMNRA